MDIEWLLKVVVETVAIVMLLLTGPVVLQVVTTVYTDTTDVLSEQEVVVSDVDTSELDAAIAAAEEHQRYQERKFDEYLEEVKREERRAEKQRQKEASEAWFKEIQIPKTKAVKILLFAIIPAIGVQAYSSHRLCGKHNYLYK